MAQKKIATKSIMLKKKKEVVLDLERSCLPTLHLEIRNI